VNRGENPYGENAIVAIMCYTGYNVEDAILVNEGAIKRGLFQTTYYSTYETHEEKTTTNNGNRKGDSVSEKIFGNIENLLKSDVAVDGMRMDYEYDALDEHGLIREGTEIHERKVLIGMTSRTGLDEQRFDESKTTKKGQLGIVDRAFMTEGEEGQRIAKIRVREVRLPAHGDKMASRAGQKGTVGLIIREEDMPFTKDGLRPDLIINPHAIPTRMTIGQLVECIGAKASVLLGGYADCTAFSNNTMANIGAYGNLLTSMGFHSSGNEIMYNGMTGEQIESHIFMGPTYYMRLKHMVKDKINYRTTGPRTALTRQPVSGRANDGGLRIGEMERDVVIAHGATNFLTESMMERGDKYYMAVCNTTGMTAIYNPAKDLFMSPMADGPIQFTTGVNDADMESGINVMKMTRFGRTFSVVCIPYSLKLLIQELQCANVQLRIITDENIRHFESLGFENGKKEKKVQIQNRKHDWEKIVLENKDAIRKNAQKRENPIPLLPTPEESKDEESKDEESNIDESNIEESKINESPEYAQGSPAKFTPPTPIQYVKGAYVGIVSENDVPWLPRENQNAWKIVDVTSDNGLITIQNLNTSSQEDSLKIVEPHQIYPMEISPETYAQGERMAGGFQSGMMVLYGEQTWRVQDVNREQNMASITNPATNETRFVSMNELHPAHSGPAFGMESYDRAGYGPVTNGNEKIHFAPTIVVGDGNYMMEPTEVTSGGAAGASVTQPETKNVMAVGTNNNNNSNINSNINSNKTEEKEEVKKEEKEKDGNPFLSFFNIKKLGF